MDRWTGDQARTQETRDRPSAPSPIADAQLWGTRPLMDAGTFSKRHQTFSFQDFYGYKRL